MRGLGSVSVNVFQTLLRVLPFPGKTGLVRIGEPDRDSPVLLTGNFRLTVERVERALAGLDAYLLVANSRGMNVWCGATGGHLTHHDVVSVLKTSGIEDLVDHRSVILPQLAATGVESGIVRAKTGWKVVWGPVYASSISAFVRGGLEKTAEMRSVKFPIGQRFEMAVMWAFPMSVLALALLPFWSQGVLPLVGLVWGTSLLIFLSFPLYEHRLHRSGKRIGFVFFDFGRHGVLLVFWLLSVLGLLAYEGLAGELSWSSVLRWGLSSFVVLLILCLDLMGSTPLYKSGLHDDRKLRIAFDADRCRGIGSCVQVCPVGVFALESGVASLPGRDRCVQCGACIVQCPRDALYFESPSGRAVEPRTVRTFKLNLLGKRRVRANGA